MVVKNVKIGPQSVPNDGTGSLRVRCTVFSKNDNCQISSVRLDLRHTSLFREDSLSPDRENLLMPSAEGDYSGELRLPALLDTGQYRLPIVANDSSGGWGRGIGFFHVSFRRPDNLPAIGAPGFTEALERAANAVFVPGNHVEILDNGLDALDRRLTLIREAQRQINVESYTFGRFGVGGQLMDALIRKADQGVEVNVVLNGDTQLPISPLNTLRLKFNQILSAWKWGDERDRGLEKTSEAGVKALRKKAKKGGVSLLLFSGKDMRARLPGPADEIRVPDHWLTRLLRDEEERGKDPAVPQEWIASFRGPGGLPALPLMDYAIHEKILLVDGSQAVVGGRNMEDQYFTLWKDVDLYLRGPVTGHIQRGFFKNFQEIAGAQEATARRPAPLFPVLQPEGPHACLFVQNKPWTREYNCLRALVLAIQAARERVWIHSQYIVLPSSLMKDALLDAASRGVDVRICTNSLRTSRMLHFASGYYISLGYIEELMAAGAKCYLASGIEDEEAPQPYSHRKEFLFDSRLAAFGSFNLSIRSSYIETENMVFIQSMDLCSAREEAYLEVLEKECAPATPGLVAEHKAAFATRTEIARYFELLY